MKTKISHLGRSSVSVILAVMMLLSTMLIGTISVNAADYFTVGDTLYLDISDANYDAKGVTVWVQILLKVNFANP